MRWWIVVLCLALAASTAGTEPAYVPLTLEEAARYIELHPDLAAKDIAAWDAVQHAMPVVAVPDALAVVAGADVVVSLDGPITVEVAGGALRYSITLRPQRFAGLVSLPTPAWLLPAACAGSAVLAVLITIGLEALVGMAK